MEASLYMLVSETMKKFVNKIILFFLIIGVVDFCYGMTFDYLNAHAKGGHNKRVNDLCEKEKYDMLIMGSSRARHHYVPKIIGDSMALQCVNAGFDGNGVILSYGILVQLIERYQPKLIVYDVEPAFDINEYALDNHCTRYLSSLKPYYRKDSVAKIIRDISLDDYYKTYSGIVRYNSCTITMLISSIKGDDEEVRKGYEPLLGSIKKKKPWSIPNEENVKLDSAKLFFFNKFVQLTVDNQIPLVVVYSPKYKLTDSLTMHTIESICKDNKVPFWDYSNFSQFMDSRLFKEPMHMNDKGAHAYSIFIASKLKDYLGQSDN